MTLAKYAILSLLVSCSTPGAAQITIDPGLRPEILTKLTHQPRAVQLSLNGTGCSLDTVETKEGLSRWSYSFGDFEARGYPIVAARPGCIMTHVYQVEPEWQYRIVSVEGSVTGQLSTGARGDISVSYNRERISENESYPPTGTTQASASAGLKGTMKFNGQNSNVDWTPCGQTNVVYSISPKIRLVQAGAQDLLRLDQLQIVWEKRECPRLPNISEGQGHPSSRS